MSNRFSVLDPDETLTDSSVSQKNLLKKAEKKLREIESLKAKKGELSKEEAEKVASEPYWQRIVTPLSKHENTGETKNKKRREQRKQREEQEREEQERQRKRAEYNRKQEREEYNRKQEREKQNKKRSFDEMQSKTKSTLDYMFVLGEFNTLNQIHQNADKTFRILSLKYHPDKNIGRDKWATAMQQHLVNVKDLF